MTKPSPITMDRIFSRCLPNPENPGCLEWQGGKCHGGYGKIKVHKSNDRRAHRWAWKLSTGQEIPEGLHVLHSCDNPPCCNPDHLRVGTRSDNMQDCLTRSRFGFQTKPERLARGDNNGSRLHPERVPRGENHPESKISEGDVQLIRYYHKVGLKGRDFYHLFPDISTSTVRKIYNLRSWKHVPDCC